MVMDEISKLHRGVPRCGMGCKEINGVGYVDDEVLMKISANTVTSTNKP